MEAQACRLDLRRLAAATIALASGSQKACDAAPRRHGQTGDMKHQGHMPISV
jgi:hypothetical protein